MPNRMLRDWTDSEKINELNVHAERFFIRLIMKVDDFGRFSANPRLLNSMLFPLLDNVRDTDITRWLAECQKAGLILIYRVDSKPYLQIDNFNQRMRQKTPKYPQPCDIQNDDGQLTVNCQSDDGLKRREEEVEEKRKRSEFRPPDFLEFKNYFLENGFDEELAFRAFNHYQVADWHDSSGRPVKNWKQKAQSVWFKKENKNDPKHSNSSKSEQKIGRIPISEAERFMQTRTGIPD